VHDLATGMPDVEFAVADLRDEDAPPARPAYALPDNVVSLVEVPFDPERESASAGAVPEADVYHALLTGSAGSLAATVARERGRRLLLTEHGLAWREAPLGSPKCIHGTGPAIPRGADRREEVHRYARRVLEQARETYAEAAAITTVCTENARLQRTQGASPLLQRVIPNAVARAAAAAPEAGAPRRIGFVGRVVPIKDVHTFLRACRLVADEDRDAEFFVIGPLDHDRGYAAGCGELAESLGLDVTFTGETDPAPWYRTLDTVVLTSISEAQPLALLEAMAHGLPVVATAVGGCPELVRGAGLLTPARDPRATARALLRLADPELRARLGAAGRERARRRHSPERLLAAYRELYDRAA
jgi:glycosyltransferase involved in cell wall biosynthesis